MFKLLPYFSAVSAAVILPAVLALSFTYRQIAVDEMVRAAEAHNVTFARMFANNLWPRLEPFIREMEGASPDQIHANPSTKKLDSAITELAKGLPVLKVKVYGRNGITVYSSDPSQIGEDKSKNLGFLTAFQDGVPASKLSYRDQFSAISGQFFDRAVVETYISIRIDNNTPAAIFELYADVTDLEARIHGTTLIIVAITLFAFVVLYGLLFLVIRHADKILKKQYADIQGNEERLHSTNESLIQANSAKSNFLALMNHELRTPLTSSIGSLGLLSSLYSKDFPEQARELVEVAKRNNEALLRLVNELLDYEKVLSGTLVIETSQQEICSLVANTIKDFRGYAQTHSINFAFNESTAPAFAEVHIHRLEQILNNLLSNAAKFSEPGSEINISVYRKDGRIFVTVEDKGLGIPEGFREVLFEHFTQADTSTTRQHSGTGLGLAIVKALTEGMDGTIDFQTEVGVGTTFILSFPASK
ncbi:MAG: HAMP domain-containing histidine kinase [Rhodospirillales bacterium]|nr:HAMP domain-containing histidine kinase [Rhodospirillales bacterium]